jgi:hypothetical protein
MATQSNSDEFFAGMKTVVRDIETGVGAEPVDVRWQYGELVKGSDIPESVRLVVKTTRGTWEGAMSREQLEDSATRVDRADVHQLIRVIVDRLSGR